MRTDGAGETRHRDERGWTYWLDDDGCRWYDQPPDWSLDKVHGDMNVKELCAAVARDVLGCDVGWWPYYCDWTCGCPGAVHGADSQCSVIADYTDPRFLRHVLDAVPDLDFSIRARPRDVCEAVLARARRERRIG